MDAEYRFDLNPALHYRASRAVATRSKVRRWCYRAFLAFPAVLVAFELLGGATLMEGVQRSLAWIVFAPIFVFVALPWLERWQIRKHYAKTPSLHGHQAFSFDESGIHMSGRMTNVSLDWEAIVEATETRGFYLFYLGKSQAYFLPVEAIPTPAAQAELQKLLRRHLGARAQFGVHEDAAFAHPA